MKKALFLIFIFSLPAIFLFPPSVHISPAWLLIYSPIAICYPIYIFRKPDKAMMKLLSYTPLICFFVALPTTLILNIFNGVLSTSFIASLTALLLALLVGYIYFGLIYCLYFSLQNWLFRLP